MHKRKKGVKIKDSLLEVAVQYYNLTEAGIEIGMDDVPNIVVLDLINQIKMAEAKIKKDKMEELKNKTK